MSNIGGPKQAQLKLLVSVTNSVMVSCYTEHQFWGRTLEYSRNNRQMLQRVQRRAALRRRVCEYRTISYEASNLLAGLPPIALLVMERKLLYNKSRREGRKTTDTEKLRQRKDTMARWEQMLVITAKGVWIRTLIPNLTKWVGRSHGEITYRLTQPMSDHGCFKKYQWKIKKSPTPMCAHCHDPDDEDITAHILLRCPA